MNGTRSTFMRKGYWLTALTAIVLLAASPGTAQAQIADEAIEITIVTPRGGVTEGTDTTITVRGKATVPADTGTAQRVSVALSLVGKGDLDAADEITAEKGTGGQIDDALFVSNPTVTLTFPANSSSTGRMRTVTQTVTLRTNHDADAEDEVVGIKGTATGASTEEIESVFTTINDDETQTYTLALNEQVHTASAPPRENAAITVLIEAVPAHVDGGDTLAIYVLGSDGRAAKGYTAMGSADGMAAIGNVGPDPSGDDTINKRTIIIAQDHTDESDGNRVTDTITLEVDSGEDRTVQRQAGLDIDVVDVHQLPAPQWITAVANDEEGRLVEEIMEGGDPIHLTITVDRSSATKQRNVTTEVLTVTIRPDDQGSYDVSPSQTSVSDGGSKTDADNEIEISARNDENVNDDELVVSLVVTGINTNGTGESIGTFRIAVADDTAKKIEPKATDADYDNIKAAIAAGAGDEGLNPGETVTLMTSDLFTVMDGYTASYGVSVEGDTVSVSVSGEALTIDALKSGDEAKITVTGTVKMSPSSLIPTQTVSDVASLTFPVMVVDTELVVTLSAEPVEIEAGGTTMITATANRAVTAGDGAVEIALAVVPEGAGTLDADSITIAMGDMSGSAMLTANESVTVVATGSGVSGLMQVAVTVTDGPAPEPVPALPLIAQWLLGLGLMGGGARQLFRRRRQGS